jgi:hemin uptake protein HemP
MSAQQDDGASPAPQASQPAPSASQPPRSPPTEIPRSPPTQIPRESWRSEELLGSRTEVLIEHNGELYRLRRTRQGKLILYK